MKKEFTKREAKKMKERLGIRWNRFDVEQFEKEVDVELEHGSVDLNTNAIDDDPLMTGETTLAHLNKFSYYYDRLEKMRREDEIFWRDKEI